MQTLFNHGATVGRILDHLTEAYGEVLPEKGILAGGAVANAILSFADGNDHKYAINDLDMFLVAPRPSKTVHRLPIHHGCPNVEIDNYNALRAISKYGYQLKGSRRRGMLNEILINMTGSRYGANVLATVVEGFDLNCCQAGIDLSSKTLYLSTGFKKFVSTRQLQAVNCSTPFQTTARILQKQEDLGCYLDLGTEIAFLSTYAAHVDAYRELPEKYTDYSRYFGKKHYRQCLKFKDRLSPFCSPEVLECIPGTEDPVENIYCLQYRQTILDELHEVTGITPEIIRSDRGGALINPFVYRNVFERVFRPTTRKVERRRFSIALSSPGTMAQTLAIPGFADCDFHPKHLRRIEKFLSSHPRMLKHLGPNVAAQYETVRVIEKAIEKYGHLHIGLLENRQGDDLPLITAEYIDGIVDEYKKEYYGQLRPPLSLRRFSRASQVRELVTACDLVEHGARMHHCVGGYAHEIKSGSSRIFELTVGESCSTLEIARSQYGRFHIRQHYGPSNTQVSTEEAVLAKLLLAFMIKKDIFRQILAGGKSAVNRLRSYCRIKTWKLKYRMRHLIQVGRETDWYDEIDGF